MFLQQTADNQDINIAAPVTLVPMPHRHCDRDIATQRLRAERHTLYEPVEELVVLRKAVSPLTPRGDSVCYLPKLYIYRDIFEMIIYNRSQCPDSGLVNNMSGLWRLLC